MTGKTKKLFLLFLIIVNCFFISISEVQAFSWFGISGIGGGLVGSVMDQAFAKLGVDQNELKYMVKTANVSRRKKQQPQVEISFTPENPVTSQRVTAVASPSYFFNSMENLYFTWYLKPNGCPDNDTSPSQSLKDKCNFDGDSNIDINDYKVNAARILASNDFGWDKADYSGSGGGRDYTAYFGGNDQKSKPDENAHCFVHDVDSGDEYTIVCDEHLFPHVPSGTQVGNGQYDRGDEKFFHTDPNDPDTADTGNGDEANVVGLGMNTFSWNYEKGDKVGVVVEGVSDEPTQDANSSFKTMWALTNNKCDLGKIKTSYPIITNIVIGTAPANIGTGATAPELDPINYCDGDINGTRKTTQTVETTKQTIIAQIGNSATIRTETYRIDTTDNNCDGIFGNDSDTSGAAYDQTTTCPNGPDSSRTSLDECGYCYSGIGTSPKTACYSDGYDKDIDLGTDILSKITKASDLNNCLEDNYADPTEGGGAKTKMDINLAYSPDFPMNDDPSPSSTYNKDGDGDQLTVQSNITNADNPGYLKYVWQLWESDSPNPLNGWGDEIKAGRLPDDLQKIGIGLDSLKLRLNIPGLKKYLKVKLTITENSSGETRTGHADVVIPVSKITQSERIKAYGTDVSNSLVLSPQKDEICLNSDKKPEAVCYAAKNEIISLSTDDKNLSDFLWTVNGNPIVPVQAGSGTIAYLPILEDNGYRYSVEMTATNNNGEKVDLVKTFEVADPEVNIVSADESVCKPNLLGDYVDLNGKHWPDYSKTNFSALTGSPIKLQAQFNGISPTLDQYSWNIDGYEINKNNAKSFGYSIDDKGVLTLTEKLLGETYNVGVGLVYTQDNNTKKALSKYWGVQINNFYEKKVGTAIEINFVGSLSDMQSASNGNVPKKILASMYSATPAYIVFLLRIVLTAFAMLIFSKIILSFFPNIQNTQNSEY